MSERTTMNGKPVITIKAKTVLNLESKFKDKLLCDGMTFSTGTACAYSCVYCYVPAMMAKSSHLKGVEQDHDKVVIRREKAADILFSQLTDARGNPKYLDVNDRRVIYASPLVDVAANLELVGETVECCKHILDLTNWTIRLLSKSPLLTRVAIQLDMERMAAAKDRVIYGLSTGTLDEQVAAAIEPDCPKVAKRIEALQWLQDRNFRTFAMVCPSLPMAHDEYLDFAGRMSIQLRYDRCEHVWAEAENLRGTSFVKTVAALKGAGLETQAKHVEEVSGDRLAWEQYARNTFVAHTHFVPPGKLRFLQYVNKHNVAYWETQEAAGAVLLGSLIHDSKTH